MTRYPSTLSNPDGDPRIYQQQYEDWHREQTEHDMIRKSCNNKREGMSFTTEEMSFTTIDSNREDDRQPDMCAHCNLNTGGEHQGNCPLGKRLQGKNRYEGKETGK